MSRFACLALLAAVAGCARIDFTGGGGSSGGAAPTGGGGASSGGSDLGGGGSEPQGGSPDPCPGVPETCNGIDDDCDGVADEPDVFPGLMCGCDWIEFDGKPYASCPTVGAPEDANCPAGMRIVVLQSMEEHDAMKELVPIPDRDGYVGMRQADGSPERDVGWKWFREGMPPPWFGSGVSEPDDYTPGAYEPVPFENDSENCAGFYNYDDGENNRGFVDSNCVGAFERVLCEPIGDECIEGAACMLEAGCTGTFDCSLPVGSQCVAVSSTEVCDGKDNDCNGSVDEDACGCVGLSDPDTGEEYRLCSAKFLVQNTRCGDGFRLAILDSVAEATWAQSQLMTGDVIAIGMYQRTTALLPEGDWLLLDASPASASLWAPGQPNDGTDMLENTDQNCGTLHPEGVFDSECDVTYAYLCEQL